MSHFLTSLLTLLILPEKKEKKRTFTPLQYIYLTIIIILYFIGKHLSRDLYLTSNIWCSASPASFIIFEQISLYTKVTPKDIFHLFLSSSKIQTVLQHTSSVWSLRVFHILNF